MTTLLVQASAVHKSFGRTEVLKGVDLQVFTGQVVCLIGRSGSGKSTLLRCINHLESIDRGELTVEGHHVGYERRHQTLHEISEREASRRRSEIGMVFQHFNLFPHMTVLQNLIEAPIKVKRESRDDATARGLDLLEQVGLADKRDEYPRQLSGGQQQRVAIARALNMQPKLMLFDEPTSALDPELVGDVIAVMKDLATTGMTMIVVTHEMGFAREAADEVLFMADGRIVESGTPQAVLDAPTHHLTRSFLSSVRGATSLRP